MVGFCHTYSVYWIVQYWAVTMRMTQCGALGQSYALSLVAQRTEGIRYLSLTPAEGESDWFWLQF